MRYDRVEECPICEGKYRARLRCGPCRRTGEISTPVETVEMWAVFGPDGEIIAVQRDEVGARLSAAGRNVNGLKWTADHLKNMKELMESDGYACEQIDIIRRKT